MYENYQKMLVELQSVVGECQVIVNEMEKERNVSELRRQEELRKQQELELQRAREEEVRREEERKRMEEEKQRMEEEKRLRLQQEEEERQRVVAENKARETARRQMEEEEEHRRRIAIIERQKAIAQTLLQKQAAEREAAEVRKRAEEEAAMKAKMEAEAAARNAWTALLDEEVRQWNEMDLCLQSPFPAVDGVQVESNGSWSLKSAQALNTIIHHPCIAYLCVVWYNPFSPKSKLLLEKVAEYVREYPMIRFVIVNTNMFPQLPFQFNAKMNSIQCFMNATRVNYTLSTTSSNSSSSSSNSSLSSSLSPSASSEDFAGIDNELAAFASDLGKRDVQQYLNVLNEETGLEGMEVEDHSITDAVKNETFGMVNMIDELTTEVQSVLDRLRKASKDGGEYQVAVHLWGVLVKNILKNPQEEKFMKIRSTNERIRNQLLRL